MGNAYIILVEQYEGKRPLDNFGEDRRKELNATLKKNCVEMWIGSMGIRIGTSD